VIPERVRRPDAELGAAPGLDSVADGDDDVEVVGGPGASALGGSGQNLHRTLPRQLALSEDVADVTTDDGPVPVGQVRHLGFCQPDRLGPDQHLDPGTAVRSLVDDDLASHLPVRGLFGANVAGIAEHG
jgi:hypothetical protein